jgi:repressor LexA
MLTRKMRELLNFIELYQAETGYSPSLDNMKDHLQVRSKSGIHRLINSLEERGMISRLHNRSRAIVILHPPTLSIRLPIEFEQRLNTVAAAIGSTPEAIVTGYIRDHLSIPTDPTSRPIVKKNSGPTRSRFRSLPNVAHPTP